MECFPWLFAPDRIWLTVVDRDRHRARKSKSPSTFGHATTRADTVTRIAPAVITMANTPA